jgi:hypothetical protein
MIRSLRRAGGEDPVDAFLQVGLHQEPGLRLLVEIVEDDEVRKPFDILKPLLIPGKDLQGTDLRRSNGLYGHTLFFSEGGVNNAYREEHYLGRLHVQVPPKGSQATSRAELAAGVRILFRIEIASQIPILWTGMIVYSRLLNMSRSQSGDHNLEKVSVLLPKALVSCWMGCVKVQSQG